MSPFEFLEHPTKIFKKLTDLFLFSYTYWHILHKMSIRSTIMNLEEQLNLVASCNNLISLIWHDISPSCSPCTTTAAPDPQLWYADSTVPKQSPLQNDSVWSEPVRACASAVAHSGDKFWTCSQSMGGILVLIVWALMRWASAKRQAGRMTNVLFMIIILIEEGRFGWLE